MNVTPFIHEKGCGLATGRDGCKCEGQRSDGATMFLSVSRSMIYPKCFQWSADVKCTDTTVNHAYGSFLEDSDELLKAVEQIWALAGSLPFQRGEPHHVAPNY